MTDFLVVFVLCEQQLDTQFKSGRYLFDTGIKLGSGGALEESQWARASVRTGEGGLAVGYVAR